MHPLIIIGEVIKANISRVDHIWDEQMTRIELLIDHFTVANKFGRFVSKVDKKLFKNIYKMNQNGCSLIATNR